MTLTFTARYQARLISLLCLLTPALADTHNTDVRRHLVGDWQCQSALATVYGNSLVTGTTALGSNGALQGDGFVLLSYPGIEADLPFASQVQGQWQLEQGYLVIRELQGELVSPYPVVNSLAAALKQQVLAQPNLRARLMRLTTRTMALRADDGTDIQCVRPVATATVP